jgi:hypothetical protein
MVEEQLPRRGETLRLALSWLVVGIPAAWGVAQTVIKVAGLFRR